MPDGSPASSTNPATWSHFRDVKHGAGDGFGVMLGNGLGCYDVDNCFHDGFLTEWAVVELGKIRELIVFAELSMSGNGLHLFFKSDIDGPGTKKSFPNGGGLERYTMGRFIRTTLNPYPLNQLPLMFRA